MRPRPRERVLLPPKLIVSGSSDIGRVRRRNEDAIALLEEFGVAVVADGMGGHPGGDVASLVACEFAAESLRDAVPNVTTAVDFGAAMLPLMESAVTGAHEAIRHRGTVEPHLDGMGTTLTALVVDADGAQFVVGHVGDSRAYLFRDGVLRQLTRDDTWVQQQIDNEIMDPAQAKNSPYAHLLTQCLGLPDTPEPQVFGGRCEVGDAFLLCTDGLVGMLDDDTVSGILTRCLTESGSDDPERAVEALLASANEAGGHDNVTAALILVR